jgi:dihydrofolate reductase
MTETSAPVLSVIAAMARNRVIGVRNTLPWRLPEDLKHFKALTLGHHIVMGRKTYESIGRPLPGRTTVIVTRDPVYRVEGCLTAGSIDAAVAACGRDPEIFFVGGAELYAQVLPRADRLYLTEIRADYEGDAWFPEFDRGQWREEARDPRVDADGLGYDFVRYGRR